MKVLILIFLVHVHQQAIYCSPKIRGRPSEKSLVRHVSSLNSKGIIVFKARYEILKFGTGHPCGSEPNLVCHGDIIWPLSFAGVSSYAVICNNGLQQLMKTPINYKSTRTKSPVCRYKVKHSTRLDYTQHFSIVPKGLTLCDGDKISVISKNVETIPSWPSIATCKVT